MTIISITPKLLISMSNGTTMEIDLNTIPQAGCEATQRWLATQLKVVQLAAAFFHLFQNGMRETKRFELVLRIKTFRYIMPPFSFSCLKRFLSRDNA